MRSSLFFLLTFLLAFLLANNSFAISIHPEVEKQYLKMGGSPKALGHLKCFLENHAQNNFDLKKANLANRCNGMAGDSRQIQINDWDHVVIVDYSKKSSDRRFFLLDLNKLEKPWVETYYVAHGKYKAKAYNSTVLDFQENSVEEIQYYSNVPNSMASSSGFFISGQVYQGRWVGPEGDKFSLVLHGINKDLNDNVCDRAIVVHGNGYVNESGPNEGVQRMSAGCFMLDYDHVNQVIAKIRGGGGDHYPSEDRLGGVLFFTYGSTEEALPSNYYCTPESTSSLRL